MEQVHVIRHKVINEEQSIRQVARDLRVSRNTVRKYLQESEPVRKEKKPRGRPVLEKVAPRIDELLEEWKNATTRKQRITGTRVYRQLREEGYQVGSTTVRDYLAEKRRQAAEVFIPLVHRPGEEAQVDFFEVTVDEKGVRKRVWKFVMRLMYAGVGILSGSTTGATKCRSWMAMSKRSSTLTEFPGGASTIICPQRFAGCSIRVES